MLRNIKILDRILVPAGELIIEQGVPGSRAYIIESGKVEVFVKNPAGETIKVAELGPDALIGEIALVGDGTRNASVRALEPTVVIVVSAHDFQNALEKSEPLQLRLLQTMETRVQEIMGLLKQHEPVEKDPETGKEAPLVLDRMMMTLAKISEKLRK